MCDTVYMYFSSVRACVQTRFLHTHTHTHQLVCIAGLSRASCARPLFSTVTVAVRLLLPLPLQPIGEPLIGRRSANITGTDGRARSGTGNVCVRACCAKWHAEPQWHACDGSKASEVPQAPHDLNQLYGRFPYETGGAHV